MSTDQPRRIKLSRARGARLPEGAVSVARPGRWGNMFKPGALVRADTGFGANPAYPADGTFPAGDYGWFTVRPVRDRADAVILHAAYVRFHDDVYPPDVVRRDLGGRDLGCWCPEPGEGQPDICHARTWLCIANGWEMPEWLAA